MKIAFTSCTRYNSYHQQNEWNHILSKNPDYLLLLGDNIYMDWGLLMKKPYRKSFDYFKSRMDKMYDLQWSNSNFKNLISTMTSRNGLHGIWDDHDCGWNNIKGGEIEEKDIQKFEYSREKFLTKFPVSKQNDNIFYSYDLEDIRFIFLDNRSYATKEKNLGETQLNFVVEKLNNDKSLTIICGGITLNKGTENFKQHSSEYDAFCKAVSESPSKVIYLSGDIHKNRFVIPENGTPSSEGIKPPFEIISSGVSLGFERKHRWCLLDIQDRNNIEASFFNRGKRQIRRSTDCTKSLNEYLR